MRKTLSFDELSLGSSASEASRFISDADSSTFLLPAHEHAHLDSFEDDEPIFPAKAVASAVLKPKANCTLLLPRILAQLIYDEPAQLLNSFTRHFSASFLLVIFSRFSEEHDLASKFFAEFMKKMHSAALHQGGDVIMCTSTFMQVIWCGHDTSEDSGHVVCRAAQCALEIKKAVEDSLGSIKLSFIVTVGSMSQVQSGGESGKYIWSLAGSATLSAQRCLPLLRVGAIIMSPEAWACIQRPSLVTSESVGSFGARLLVDFFPKISIPVSINRIVRPAAQDMLPEWPDRKLALVGMYMCAPLTSKLQEPLLLNIFDGTKRSATCVIVSIPDIAADFSRSQETLLFSPMHHASSLSHVPAAKPNINSSTDSGSANTSFDMDNFSPSPPPIDTIDRQAVRSFHSDVNATILHLQRVCAGKSGRLLWASHDSCLPGLTVCCVFGLDAPVLNLMSTTTHDSGTTYTQALDFVKLLQLRRCAAVGVASSSCYPVILGEAASGRLTPVVIGNCVADAIMCCDAALKLPEPEVSAVATSPTMRPRISRVVADEHTAQKWSAFRRVKTVDLCDVSLNMSFCAPPTTICQAFVFQKVDSDAVVSLRTMSTMLMVNSFVGRSEEVTKLRSILHDFMYNSMGGVVCVQGEAGFGKSALIDHILNSNCSVFPSGIQLMKIKCRPSVMHGPLQVWKEVLCRFPAYASLELWASFCSYLKANYPEFSKIQQHMRLLAPSDGDVASGNMAPLRAEQQHGILVLIPLILRAFTTGHQQFRLASRFVFVFEDVQTQSPFFWRILRALSCEHLSWLFMLTHRTQPASSSGNLDATLNVLNYHTLNVDKEMIISPSKYTSLTLQPFTQHETGLLIKAMLSAESMVDSILEAIFVVTQGSPRCISEVIEVLHRRGVLHVVGSCVTAVGSGRVEVDIAHAVADAATTSPMELALKLVRGFERLVMRIAAIAQVPLSDEMFCKLLNLGISEIRHALDKLTNVLGVFEKHAGNKYAFKHEVYRHWITHRMKTFEIQELHLKCAMVWEALGYASENPLLLAYHYENCGNSTIAIQYYESCADRAFESHEYAYAVSLYSELIRLASAHRNFDRNLLFQYRLNYGKSFVFLGQMAVAQSELESAAAFVNFDLPRSTTVNHMFTMLSAVANCCKYSSSYRYYGPLFRRSQTALAPGLAWELLTAMYQTYLWRNQSRMALACCARAACLDVSEELRAVSLAQTALTCTMAAELSWMGRHLEEMARRIVASLEHPSQEVVFQIYLALGLRSSVFCRWKHADEDLRQAQKAAKLLGSDHHICTAGLFAAQNALWRADLIAANQELSEIQDKGVISSLSQSVPLYCFYRCLRIMIDFLFVRNYSGVKQQCDEILQHVNDIHSLAFLLIYPLLALAECKIGNWQTADVYCGEIVERFYHYSDAAPWMVGDAFIDVKICLTPFIMQVHWMPLFIGRTILETECRGKLALYSLFMSAFFSRITFIRLAGRR
jgi:tetratricopeptide (TPR) repeat protein